MTFVFHENDKSRWNLLFINLNSEQIDEELLFE
jgi:hypothetical protein